MDTDFLFRLSLTSLYLSQVQELGNVLSTCMVNQSCCSWGLMVRFVYNDWPT